MVLEISDANGQTSRIVEATLNKTEEWKSKAFWGEKKSKKEKGNSRKTEGKKDVGDWCEKVWERLP